MADIDKVELKEAKKLYKLAGIAILIIIIAGITISWLTRPETPVTIAKPEAQPEPKVEVPEQNATVTETAPIINETKPTVNETKPAVNETAPVNATVNVTQNVTAPVEQNKTPLAEMSWNTVKIEFPSTLNKVIAGKNSYHYITITEGDGSPITNGEQFEIQVSIPNYQGQSQVVPTFENGKWLIMLLLNNKGKYDLNVKISCEDQKGHCKRFYDETSSVEKSSIIEVI